MSMFKVCRKEIEWGGRTLVLETGKMARQANGSVIATYGETSVLCTAVGQRKPKKGIDFFPLTVNYQEKTFAAGKIPGGFFKREGRPTEKETLTSRLIDRPLRPLFHESYRNETQVVCTVLSHDLENDPDIIALVGASAALTISGIPFLGPIGAARIGYKDGQYILNPAMDSVADSELDLVLAGTREGVLMVESQANELSEEVMLGAVTYGHEQMQNVISGIIDLAEMCAKEPFDLAEPPAEISVVKEKFTAFAGDIEAAYQIKVKQDRQNAISAAKARAIESLGENDAELAVADKVLKTMEKDIVRGQILKTGQRIDERTTVDVRQIEAEVGVLPRAHGSALFTRGETQALVTATLGTGRDEQIIDALEGEHREHFMLHYNFPPYSVGETGRMGGAGRREIGHGKLAWRAIRPLLPAKEDFPYTLRVVSEITESNGSSSMATVCGASLALMDGGVPLLRPVAGIAMGLIKEGDDFAVLSDILGDEDHLGDMDFKVAGTDQGITSLQMDIKITSITSDIMDIALKQAKDGRLHILGEMTSALSSSRDQVAGHAPRITTLAVPKDKIRDIIGTGGKVIREIQEETGCKIDIEDDGTVKVASSDQTATDDAVARIRDIIAEAEVGTIYTGKVVKLMDFGAFVNFLGKRDGLVHISELAPYRVNQVSDIVKEGDIVKVKCLAVDDRGKVKLSMKRVDQETGEDIDGKESDQKEESKPAEADA